MAQLRHDQQKFSDMECGIVVIVPNGPKMIARYLQSNPTNYIILSDRGARVTDLYGIHTRRIGMVQAFKPGVFLVDRSGTIRYTNYLRSYVKEPDNNAPLVVLAGMNN
jgi:peroxiredoxin